MWDLIFFDLPNAQSANVAKLGARFFSSSDTDKARVAAKRAEFLHFPAYEDDVGVIRTAKESECTLLVAVSDFLDLTPEALGRRIGLARKFVWMAHHFGAKVKLVSLAKDEWQRRDEREMMMIGLLFGFTPAQMRMQEKEEMPTEIRKSGMPGRAPEMRGGMPLRGHSP